jgi:ClpP class serine protease
MGTQLASEPQLLIYDHLRRIGKVKKLDLFLYTRGGETDAVMPFVNAIREHCEIFGVLVPFRAHSGGTLICLGADEIVMGPFGELSPIDPTTGNQFSPIDELNPKARKGISVEDVTSYMALAKDKNKVGIEDEKNVLEVFKTLSQAVHPLALGHVNRVHTHIRLLADRLLRLGQNRKLGDKKAKEVVDVLTEKLYSHTHAIGRQEARELVDADIVKFASEEEERLMWDLFEEYATLMSLRQRFNIKEYMGKQVQREITVNGAFLESENMPHLFQCASVITQRSELPPNFQVQVQVGQPIPLIPGFPTQFSVELIREGWQLNEGGV